MRNQLELVRLSLESGSKQLKLWADAKDYSEYVAAQAELAQEDARKVLVMARETIGVIAAFVENSVEAVSATVKPALAKKAAAA